MKIEFVYFMVFWLNAFPVRTGTSGVYSPQKLIVALVPRLHQAMQRSARNVL